MGSCGLGRSNNWQSKKFNKELATEKPASANISSTSIDNEMSNKEDDGRRSSIDVSSRKFK